MAGEPEVRGQEEAAKAGVKSQAVPLPAGTVAGDLALISVISQSTTGTPPPPKQPPESTVIEVSPTIGATSLRRVVGLYWHVVTGTDVTAKSITVQTEGETTPSALKGVLVIIKTGTFNASAPIDNHTAWVLEESATPQYGSIEPSHALSLALGYGTFTGTLTSDPPAEWTSVVPQTAESTRVISHACGESLASTPPTTIGKSTTAQCGHLMLTLRSASVGGPVSVKAAAGVKVSGFGLSAGAPVIRAAAIIRTVIASKGGPVTVRAGAKVGVYAPPVIYEPIEIGAAAAVNVAGEPAQANIVNVRAGARVSTAGVKLSGGVVRIRAGARVGVKVVISLTPPTRMVIRGTTTRAQVRGATTTARLRGG